MAEASAFQYQAPGAAQMVAGILYASEAKDNGIRAMGV
jgi:hypothetical protein